MGGASRGVSGGSGVDIFREGSACGGCRSGGPPCPSLEGDDWNGSRLPCVSVVTSCVAWGSCVRPSLWLGRHGRVLSIHLSVPYPRGGSIRRECEVHTRLLSTVGLHWTGYIDCAGSIDHILIPSGHLFSYLVWGSGRRTVQRLKNAWGCGPVTAAERAGTPYDAAVTMTTSFTMHSLSQHSHARARCPVFLSLHGMGGVVGWCIHRRGLWLV